MKPTGTSGGALVMAREWIYPADVSGRFRSWRKGIGYALVVFFVVTPWIHIGGLPAVQIDIPGRRLLLFGSIFTPHDMWALGLLALIASICLFFFASVFGRVWCGWACPQTVWLDWVYRPVERLIEGKSNKRRKMDGKPWREWPAEWWARKIGKHVAFVLLTAALTGIFMSWFVGGPQLLHGELSGAGWSVAGVLFTLFFLDAVWFREQLCIYACPYARFQGAMMSERSLIVAYDAQRGEPRKEARSTDPHGDCIDCLRCVQVCPSGIDIRHGDQLSCIACASCIDACDDVMIQIGKPKGLIRYTTDRDATGVQPLSLRVLGKRSLAYTVLLAALGGALVIGMATRSPVKVAIARAVSDAIYRELPDGKVANQLTVHISNRANRAHTFLVRSGSDSVLVTVPGLPWSVAWGEEARLQAFVSAPAEAFQGGRLPARILVERDDGLTVEATFTMLGPGTPHARLEHDSGDAAAEVR